MSSHVPTGAQSLPSAGIGKATDMVCIADIAARLCGRDLLDVSDVPIPSGQGTSPRPAWRRAPRTKAALALKILAVEKAVRVLEDLDIPYTQPLFGRLVIEPPPAVQRGKSVTFWPAKERLRVARRATQTKQDVPAFEQALADQGHHIPGYVSRPARLFRSPRLSKEERLRARQEADLAEMEHAHVQLMASLREMTEDLIAGRRVQATGPSISSGKATFQTRSRLRRCDQVSSGNLSVHLDYTLVCEFGHGQEPRTRWRRHPVRLDCCVHLSVCSSKSVTSTETARVSLGSEKSDLFGSHPSRGAPCTGSVATQPAWSFRDRFRQDGSSMAPTGSAAFA